jgi:calcium uptake protein 1, mitochondrial
LASCEEASRADIIRGNYENKIRFFSSPEKTFEVFASEKSEDGKLCMSYKDFLRAMTPFCYKPFFEGGAEYVEKQMPSIIKRVDADNDGLISFTEFFFFLVLLQLSYKDLKKAFDDFEGGKMHRDAASDTLRKLRKQTQAG